MTTENGRREIVITFQGQHGTHREVHLSPAAAIAALVAQTAAGSVAQSVHLRDMETGHFNRDAYPELY